MEDHNTDEKLWIMGNYVSGFSKSNTQMKYIQFMLWIFVEGKPPKKSLLYPWMADDMDPDYYRDINNKGGIKLWKVCKQAFCAVTLPYFCILLIFCYFPGKLIQGRQWRVILERIKFVSPGMWRTNKMKVSLGWSMINIYYQILSMMPRGVTYPNCIESSQQKSLIIFWRTYPSSYTWWNIPWKIKGVIVIRRFGGVK